MMKYSFVECHIIIINNNNDNTYIKMLNEYRLNQPPHRVTELLRQGQMKGCANTQREEKNADTDRWNILLWNANLSLSI